MAIDDGYPLCDQWPCCGCHIAATLRRYICCSCCWWWSCCALCICCCCSCCSRSRWRCLCAATVSSGSVDVDGFGGDGPFADEMRIVFGPEGTARTERAAGTDSATAAIRRRCCCISFSFWPHRLDRFPNIFVDSMVRSAPWNRPKSAVIRPTSFGSADVKMCWKNAIRFSLAPRTNFSAYPFSFPQLDEFPS